MDLLLDKVADDTDLLISDILFCELMLGPSLVAMSACCFDVDNSRPYHMLQWELFRFSLRADINTSSLQSTLTLFLFLLLLLYRTDF